jgi:hypothetical protein
MPRECGYGWEDAANVREHPRHRCNGEFMHRGIHVCGVTYRDASGNRVFCGVSR